MCHPPNRLVLCVCAAISLGGGLPGCGGSASADLAPARSPLDTDATGPLSQIRSAPEFEGLDLLLGPEMQGTGFEAELFDGPALEHPQSRGAVLLGNYQPDSEALIDEQVFGWLPNDHTGADAGPDRFAVPVTITPRSRTWLTPDPVKGPF